MPIETKTMQQELRVVKETQGIMDAMKIQPHNTTNDYEKKVVGAQLSAIYYRHHPRG